jgi:competence transcription factor ComK
MAEWSLFDPMTNINLEKRISDIDTNFRLLFENQIKEVKLLTHKCQYLCYLNNKTLLDSEECSRNCFKPLLYIKKNISTLVENQKEKFEKCKSDSLANNKDTVNKNKGILKCLEIYKQDLNKLKDEGEYIYSGYIKNFETLLPNKTDNKI